MKTGKLYLIPTLINEGSSLNQISLFTKEVIEKTDYYIVENEKSARSFIKKYINTMRIFEWKNIKIELNKKPTIFIIESIYN